MSSRNVCDWCGYGKAKDESLREPIYLSIPKMGPSVDFCRLQCLTKWIDNHQDEIAEAIREARTPPDDC